MYLMIQNRLWDETRFKIDSYERDYSLYEQDGTYVFVYGYPFDENAPGWLYARAIYNLYKKYGTRFADNVEGVFTIIINDRNIGKCFIITDRYGVYRMFYSYTGECIVISDLINEIVPHLSHITLNYTSILEYLNFGFKLGNKTHIDQIFQFEYGSVYEIDRNLKIMRKPYWSIMDSLNAERMTAEEFVEIFNNHINTALKLEDRVSLPLSGGMDSRAILSACIKGSANFRCYTHECGYLSRRDMKIAQKICSRLRLPHSTYELDDDFGKEVPSMACDNLDIFNGLAPAVNYMHVLKSYSREKAYTDLLLSGAMGSEVWRCYLDKRPAQCSNVDDMCSKIMKYSNAPAVFDADKHLCSGDMVSILKSSIMNEFYKNGGHEPMFNEVFTFIGDFQNFAGTTLKVLGRYFKVFAGFAQKDLLNQVLASSPRDRANGLMHKYIIQNNCRKLLNHPLDSGLFVDMNSINTIRSFIIRGSSRINRSLLKLTKGCVSGKPYHTEYPYWFRRFHSDYLKEILCYDNMATAGIFDRRALDNTVEAFLNGDNTYSNFIFYLLSLEMWLKRLKKAGINL